MTENIIGTFIVKKPVEDQKHLSYDKGWQIGYCSGIDKRPEMNGKFSTLAQKVTAQHLRLNDKEYIEKLISFGGIEITLAIFNQTVKPSEISCDFKHKPYAHKEVFFEKEEEAQNAADWANSLLVDLKLNGREYKGTFEEFMAIQASGPLRFISNKTLLDNLFPEHYTGGI